MEGVSLPPGIPGLSGSTDPLEAVLGCVTRVCVLRKMEIVFFFLPLKLFEGYRK